MRYIYIVLVAVFIFPPLISAQSIEKQKEWFDDGFFFYKREEYKEALYNFNKLFQLDTTNTHAAYFVGMSYLNIPGQEYLGIPYFEKAATDMTKDYKEKSFEVKQAPYHTLFYLGNAYRINNELGKALAVYLQFRELPRFEDIYNLRILQEEVTACERAKIIQDSPIVIKEIRLNENINNSSDNYNAVVSGDEMKMVYMSEQKFYNAIYYSQKIKGNWAEPINITPMVGSDGDAYPTSMSYDGNTIYLVKSKDGNKDIYTSTLKEGKWSRMKPLNDNVNTKWDETHAAISSDGLKLLVTSARRGGMGETDIYLFQRSEINKDWGKATNLGLPINTPKKEETPFFSENGKKIFFSSQGLYNMGGFDVFYSELKNDKWSDPINLGYPINTTGDDLFFVPIKDGNEGYYTLIKRDTGTGKDIYKIKILKNNISNPTIQKPVK